MWTENPQAPSPGAPPVRPALCSKFHAWGGLVQFPNNPMRLKIKMLISEMQTQAPEVRGRAQVWDGVEMQARGPVTARPMVCTQVGGQRHK